MTKKRVINPTHLHLFWAIKSRISLNGLVLRKATFNYNLPANCLRTACYNGVCELKIDLYTKKKKAETCHNAKKSQDKQHTMVFLSVEPLCVALQFLSLCLDSEGSKLKYPNQLFTKLLSSLVTSISWPHLFVWKKKFDDMSGCLALGLSLTQSHPHGKTCEKTCELSCTGRSSDQKAPQV